ncbi:hypothetical protein GOP47_0000023 [Adiantum capillus-veneris]|uniref:C17orf113 probable zinc finger domain-containing protein n=1 Tax=Adiantum capillus-veneris TaxID=13818 RepID=A0A9D4VD39_ADICA|nr:hypothetical protein GOP47_0000023 [Adiantum capillus-veneris]
MSQSNLLQQKTSASDDKACASDNKTEKQSMREFLKDIFGSDSEMEDIVEIEDTLEVGVESLNAHTIEEIEGVRQSTDGSHNGVSTTTEMIAPTKAKKVTVRKFRQEWTITYPFVFQVIHKEKEFMKCAWCTKYKVKGPWGKGNGCKTIMKSAIRKHRKSKEHVWAATKHYSEGGKQMKTHEKEVISKNRHRVITVMKLAYFNAKEDLAIRKYEGLCGLAYSLNVEEMPIQHDYSSYTNMMAGKEFIFCISKYLDDLQKQKLLQSPYYALMVDETTYRSLEKHLIIYFSFLAPKCSSCSSTEITFAKLLTVPDGCAQTKFDAIMKMMKEVGLNKQQLVGIATDGDS